MPTEEAWERLAEKVSNTAESAAMTAAHVEHVRDSTDKAWEKLDRLNDKLEGTKREILDSLPCWSRAKECEDRFDAIEMVQGITTTKLMGIVAFAFIGLEVVIHAMKWLAGKAVGAGATP